MIKLADPGAVLFNLTNQTAFKVIDTDKAITCWKDYGPYFTAALYTRDEPFNGGDRCMSACTGTYESQLDSDGFDRLIQSEALLEVLTWFSITELEVWAVKFSTQ